MFGFFNTRDSVRLPIQIANTALFFISAVDLCNNPTDVGMGSLKLIAFGLAALSLNERTDAITKVSSSTVNLVQMLVYFARHISSPTTSSPLSDLPVIAIFNLANALAPLIPDEQTTGLAAAPTY